MDRPDVRQKMSEKDRENVKDLASALLRVSGLVDPMGIRPMAFILCLVEYIAAADDPEYALEYCVEDIKRLGRKRLDGETEWEKEKATSH